MHGRFYCLLWVLMRRRRQSWLHTSSRMWLRYGTRYRSGWPSGLRCQIQVLVFTKGDNIRDERVYRECPTIILDRITYVDLIELTMLDFDIIFGMDWLHKCYATIDYRNGGSKV